MTRPPALKTARKTVVRRLITDAARNHGPPRPPPATGFGKKSDVRALLKLERVTVNGLPASKYTAHLSR
jgi:hypothetical protein